MSRLTTPNSHAYSDSRCFTLDMMKKQGSTGGGGATDRLTKPSCLIVCSAVTGGVSAPSFLQTFNLASSAFNLQVASPGGKALDFVGISEIDTRWFQDFQLKPYANPARLESIDEPICAVGHGVNALCCVTNEDKTWAFQDYSVTGPSVYELVRHPDFASLPLILEDFAKDSGATFSASEPDAVHMVLDRHLITGQNENSTMAAVQNLILLCNGRK
ncbi:glutamine amidotransferase-like class 1 domain-containing protein 1 isoform X2 [Dendrobates tinctorius]|uniref:glutamine amidotransferase-like class 1 domain-containing protein 1 isoform X2 n=1 Tax=Dendrobates tinctorius TaxID=92724 RepID=UPI003CC947D4